MGLLDLEEVPFAPSNLVRLAQDEGRLTRLNDLASAVCYKGSPVEWSRDLERIAALPRRKYTDAEAKGFAEKWTELLRRKDSPKCDCVERWGFCIKRLNTIQGVALEEGHRYGGLLGPIGVGHGKTGIDILLPVAMQSKRALLLVPPSLRAQFTQRDYLQWGAHFKVPNLAGGPFYVEGRSQLIVVAYSELSQPKNSDLMARINPDLIIADEAHNLKDKKSARTKRFLRLVAQAPSVRFVALSGTITRRSLKDYAHLSEHALKEGSPLPTHYPTLDEWAAAIDAGDFPKPMGALGVLCESGETVREGFCRRLTDTPGVVSTKESPVDCSLIIKGLHPSVPYEIETALEAVRSTATRPDGEEAQSALDVAEWCKQLACGFYYRWVYPRGEPVEVIDKWFRVRQAFNKELREKLKHSREFMDSPKLLVRAAIRFYNGYTYKDEVTGKSYQVPPRSKSGPLPTWECVNWPEWHEVKNTVVHKTAVVWVSSYLAELAAKWASTNRGVLWYSFSALGERVAELSGAPRFGGGPDASSLIIREDGKRSIVASIDAHGTGKNLQMFDHCLVTTPPSSGLTWEQMLGRHHRQGQLADEVQADVYLHTPELFDSFRSAVSQARYTQETQNLPQKLCFASLVDVTPT